jgi:ATPases with chaperone activity, ATP-binding subunit
LCVEHILYALLHNDAGLNVIRSCGGDTTLIKQDLEDFFSQQEEFDGNKLPRQTRAVQRVLHLAIMHVNSFRKKLLPMLGMYWLQFTVNLSLMRLIFYRNRISPVWIC